ncbi:alcohol dehydrogenase catalytic domain-containing protein [bacterium]|nr:alcohol dehydrogenase catalytic domain-containing protein [bacterium]
MRAIVNYGPLDYRLENVPDPIPGPEEVVIRVKASGLCASDLKCYHGGPSFWQGNPPYVKPPVIPGHEFVGEVVALGEGAKEKYGIDIGDKAVAEQILPCWECRFCKTGKYWMCERNYVFGFQGGIDDGGMAEYAKFPKGSIIHKVPKELPDEYGALIEPLSCAIHAVERGEIQLGDTVVISGMGPIGLMMLQVAKLKNPGLLIALDTRDFRLEVAQKLGADIVINVAREDAVKKVKELTDGYGCDVYIEASGYPKSVPQGLDMIRKLGTFVEFGVFAEPVLADWTIIGDRKELNIHGSHLGPYRYPLAIDYLAKGIIRGNLIVTHKFPLENFKDAIKIAEDPNSNSIKILIIP